MVSLPSTGEKTFWDNVDNNAETVNWCCVSFFEHLYSNRISLYVVGFYFQCDFNRISHLKWDLHLANDASGAMQFCDPVRFSLTGYLI